MQQLLANRYKFFNLITSIAMNRLEMRYKLRRENFARIRARYKTNVALAAALSDESAGEVFAASFVSQLLSGHRGIGDDVADKIESRLNLPYGYLDREEIILLAPDAETTETTELFEWVYRYVSEDGRALLRNTIKAVSKAYLTDDRRNNALTVINDRRTE